MIRPAADGRASGQQARRRVRTLRRERSTPSGTRTSRRRSPATLPETGDPLAAIDAELRAGLEAEPDDRREPGVDRQFLAISRIHAKQLAAFRERRAAVNDVSQPDQVPTAFAQGLVRLSDFCRAAAYSVPIAWRMKTECTPPAPLNRASARRATRDHSTQDARTRSTWLVERRILAMQTPDLLHGHGRSAHNAAASFEPGSSVRFTFAWRSRKACGSSRN